MEDLIEFKNEKIEKHVFSIEGMDQTYVQIKATSFILNNKNKVMLQFIDVSHSIMYDQ